MHSPEPEEIEKTTNEGIVLNLQRFSVHDGPGIRTLVFMKGCPLRCLWCSNPESQTVGFQLGFIESRCVGCGKCIEVCPVKAIKRLEDGRIYNNRALCTNCGKCVEVCLYEAREIAGKESAIEKLVKEVEEDRDFYANSGGGVTVGGGEPLIQHGFVREFLKRCQDRWLHTAMETCGHSPWEHLEKVLEYVDYLFYDIKHMDPVIHREITGVSNELILGNIEKIIANRIVPAIVIRIPVIPGLNDSEANIESTAKFISGLGPVKGIELLPYHRLGNSKYDQFGMKYKLDELRAPCEDHMQKLNSIIESFGLAIE